MTEKNTTRYEEFEVAGRQLVARVRQLVRQGNVTRVHLKKATGETVLELPLTAGVAVATAGVLAAPALIAVGSVAAVFARLRIGVERPAGQAVA